ncbi:MAG: hypothetical protein WKF35_11510 [Ferruginibacter sp.]
MKIKSDNKHIAWILIIINLIFQYFLVGKYITDDAISALHPINADALEYINASEAWLKTNDFVSVFRTGWRLPGYPFLILCCYKMGSFINLSPILLVKIFQLLLSSLIPYFSYKSIFNFSSSHFAALVGGLIVCIYYPFYYYTPSVGAESLSLFLISLLFYQTSKFEKQDVSIKNLLFIAMLIAILTYLKPNHILFSIPVVILLIKKQQLFSGKVVNALSRPVMLACFVIMFMLPWMIFVTTQNKIFIPLATTSGEDMLIGTGITINKYNRDIYSLTYKFEQKHNLNADTVFMTKRDGKSLAELNSAFQKDAISIWKSRPWITTQFGFIKIAHSIGFSLRNFKDYFSLFVNIPIILILLFFKDFRKRYKNITILVSILILLCWLQSFVYFGDMRLRIVMADLAIIFTGSIFLNYLFENRNKAV